MAKIYARWLYWVSVVWAKLGQCERSDAAYDRHIAACDYCDSLKCVHTEKRDDGVN